MESEAFPTQVFSLPNLLHNLVLVFNPFPQVAEHELYELHWDHSGSEKYYELELNVQMS